MIGAWKGPRGVQIPGDCYAQQGDNGTLTNTSHDHTLTAGGEGGNGDRSSLRGERNALQYQFMISTLLSVG